MWSMPTADLLAKPLYIFVFVYFLHFIGSMIVKATIVK